MCETCAHLEWDEEEETYYCSVDIDEDDYARMMLREGGRRMQTCPYWMNADEYAVVRHQAF